jgi:hypothetical protein
VQSKSLIMDFLWRYAIDRIILNKFCYFVFFFFFFTTHFLSTSTLTHFGNGNFPISFVKVKINRNLGKLCCLSLYHGLCS